MSSKQRTPKNSASETSDESNYYGSEDVGPELQQILEEDNLHQYFSERSGGDITHQDKSEIMEKLLQGKGKEESIEEIFKIVDSQLPEGLKLSKSEVYNVLNEQAEVSSERSREEQNRVYVQNRRKSRIRNFLVTAAVLGVLGGSGLATYFGNTVYWNSRIEQKVEELSEAIQENKDQTFINNREHQQLMDEERSRIAELESYEREQIDQAVAEIATQFYVDRYGDLPSLAYSHALSKNEVQQQYFMAEVMSDLDTAAEQVLEDLLISDITGDKELPTELLGTHDQGENTLESYKMRSKYLDFYVITSTNAQGANNFVQIYEYHREIPVAAVQFTDAGFKTIDYTSDKMIIVEDGVKVYDGDVQVTEKTVSETIYADYMKLQDLNPKSN